MKDVFSSADVIIYYGADGNLSPFDITGIGQESNRVVDAMAEFSEARAVPDRCSEFKTYGIEEAAEFIGCEKFGKEHGIEDAYDEFSEKQLNQLKIDDDKEFLRECRPLFCPKCETRMEQKTLEVQFGSSANAMTARSVGCHVCPICGRITFDDDDMRVARGYKETVKLAIDGVAGGSITDYGRRNAENYGARWERYYREGYLERYFARLDEALAEAAERGDVTYIGNRWAHSQAKAEAEGWVRRKTERWCKIAEKSSGTPRRGGPTSSRRLSKKAAPTRFSASSASMALTPTTDSCACPFVPHTAERSAPRSRRLPGARSRCHPASWRPRRIPCLYPWGR